MKFLVPLFAIVALASATFVGGKYTDLREDGAWNQQNTYGLNFFGKYFRGQGIHGQDYNQYSIHYFYNVLIKIFDRQVLKMVLTQEQMYNQEMYEQYSYEKMWDMVFSHEGIFDSQYLMEILNNEVLRNYFVQQGFFDAAVLDQILVSYQTRGIYDQYLLQRLFNTQVLKYFFITHRISVYDILKQNMYNNYYGSTYDHYYGNTYGHYYGNKGIYGYNNFFQQTPKMTYKHLVGVYRNVPEYANNMQMYGGDFWKNMMYGQQYYGYNQGPYTYGKFYHQYPVSQQVY